MLKGEAGCDRGGPSHLSPVVIDGTATGKVEVAEDSEGECSKVREIDAADSLQEERAVVEAASFFVGQGKDKAAEQEEEDDGLMSGSEEA